MLISQAQRKQAKKYEAYARNAEAQIDMLQKRAEKAEGHKREFVRRARETNVRWNNLRRN